MNIKKRWEIYCDSLRGSKKYFFVNSQISSMYRELNPVIRENAKGVLLDLGCGKLAYKEILSKYADKYVSSDKYACHPEIDYISDIKKLPFSNNEFDTVFCSQVFEHLPRPWDAIREVSRILKPGGLLILTVPHLTYVHGEPEDFYRFTKYGISELAKIGGFRVKKITPSGGLIGFFLTPFSIVFLSLFGRIRYLGPIFFYINYLIVFLSDTIDSVFGRNGIYCYNYIALLRKE